MELITYGKNILLLLAKMLNFNKTIVIQTVCTFNIYKYLSKQIIKYCINVFIFIHLYNNSKIQITIGHALRIM